MTHLMSCAYHNTCSVLIIQLIVISATALHKDTNLFHVAYVIIYIAYLTVKGIIVGFEKKCIMDENDLFSFFRSVFVPLLSVYPNLNPINDYSVTKYSFDNLFYVGQWIISQSQA